MGLYRKHLLPRLVDLTCGASFLAPHRQQVCSGLRGEVLEIGFGSGLNVPHYPSAVTHVRGVEPEALGWRLAAKRLAESPVLVEPAGLDGQALPFADDEFDSALSTFTLCTIPDVDNALREVRRVLKPGGTLMVLEHGLAPDVDVQRWQRRFEPVQKRVAGGCHLTRDVRGMLEAAGFQIATAESFYQVQTPKPFGALTVASATA